MPIEFLGARYFGKGVHYIRPASEFDQDKLAGIPEGRAINVVVTYPPHPKARNAYYGMLGWLVEAGVFQNKEEADFTLRLKAKRYEAITVTTGTDGMPISTTFKPMSTAEWDGPAWQAFLRDVTNIVLTELIPGIGASRARKEIERFCRIDLKDAITDGG